MQEFDTIRFLEQCADSPVVQVYFETNFCGEAALLSALLDEVDESVFSLRQWVEALVVLSQWLEERGLALSIEERLGYVSCAAASAGSAAGALSDLSSLVGDFLGQYGCERAVKK